MKQRAPFPTDPQEFDDDSRISYSKETRTYLLEDENGDEWEWLQGPAKWSKTMDEALIKQQSEIYKVAGVDEDAPALNPAQKRKQGQPDDPNTNAKHIKTATGVVEAAKSRQNTAVFVTGLPLDVDPEEIRDFFGRYGMIAESLDGDEKRIKLYNDKNGNFKGEALIIYHRAESVMLAIDMADGAYFPRQDTALPTSLIAVVVADNSYKAQKDDTVADDRPRPKAIGASRVKAKKKVEEMNKRLADWSDDEPSALPQTSSKWDKVVIIKHVFTFENLKEENFLEDVQLDMQEDGEIHGEVKNVTIFDQEEDGVVTIRFANAMAAKACAATFNGRSYDGRVLETEIATGEERFKKSRKVASNRDEDEQKRLEEYSNYIEGKTGTGDGGAHGKDSGRGAES